MNTKLSECVDALKDVRRDFYNSTDPSIGLALDKVIAHFESYIDGACIEEGDIKSAVGESMRIISLFLNCCLGLADLIGRF